MKAALVIAGVVFLYRWLVYSTWKRTSKSEGFGAGLAFGGLILGAFALVRALLG